MSVCLWVLWMLSWQNYFPFRKGNTEVLGWKWTDCIFFSYLAWEAQAGLWKQHSQGEYWHTSPDAISYLCGSVIYVGLNAYAHSCYCCLVMSSLGSVWKCTFFFFFFFWPRVSELQVAVTDSCESLLAGHTLCSRCWLSQWFWQARVLLLRFVFNKHRS